jgi:hypothetical protein
VLSNAVQQDSTEHIMPPLNAAEELNRALQSGTLQARGVLFGSDDDVAIPPERWVLFPYVNDRDERPNAVFSKKGGTPQYEDVLVQRLAVREIWTPNKLANDPTPSSASIPIPKSYDIASEVQIRATIRLIYDRTVREGYAAPNSANIVKAVQEILSRGNLSGGWRDIQEFAKKEPCQNKLKRGARPETKGLKPFSDMDLSQMQCPN